VETAGIGWLTEVDGEDTQEKTGTDGVREDMKRFELTQEDAQGRNKWRRKIQSASKHISCYD